MAVAWNGGGRREKNLLSRLIDLVLDSGEASRAVGYGEDRLLAHATLPHSRHLPLIWTQILRVEETQPT